MAASKFDRNRGDKLTIMTASFREKRDQRSAEQIMLKNIAEKIELLEQKERLKKTRKTEPGRMSFRVIEMKNLRGEKKIVNFLKVKYHSLNSRQRIEPTHKRKGYAFKGFSKTKS